MSTASARDAAAMAKHTALTAEKILFAQIVTEKEDAKTYKKDVKALKWLLYYIGED